MMGDKMMGRKIIILSVHHFVILTSPTIAHSISAFELLGMSQHEKNRLQASRIGLRGGLLYLPRGGAGSWG